MAQFVGMLLSLRLITVIVPILTTLVKSECPEIYFPCYYKDLERHVPEKKKNRVLFQYKNRLSIYGYFCCKDKAVVRLSYLYNGNPCTGMTASLYMY